MSKHKQIKKNSVEAIELSSEEMEALTGGNPWAAAAIAMEVWDFGYAVGTAIDEATGLSDAISKAIPV